MSFNADAVRQAARPWIFTTGGRSWTALPVSAVAVQRFYAQLGAALTDPAKQERALISLLRQAFPWRLSFWWRGDPVRLLVELPPTARSEALLDFFGSLAGTATPRQTRTTHGRASWPSKASVAAMG